MSHKTPAMLGSDPPGLKQDLRSFRAGLTKRDLVLAGAVIGLVTVPVLVKLLTGWPHFRIFGGAEQIFGVLAFLAQPIGAMVMVIIRTHTGYDDLGNYDDDSGTGGASGSW